MHFRLKPYQTHKNTENMDIKRELLFSPSSKTSVKPITLPTFLNLLQSQNKFTFQLNPLQDIQ